MFTPAGHGPQPVCIQCFTHVPARLVRGHPRRHCQCLDPDHLSLVLHRIPRPHTKVKWTLGRRGHARELQAGPAGESCFPQRTVVLLQQAGVEVLCPFLFVHVLVRDASIAVLLVRKDSEKVVFTRVEVRVVLALACLWVHLAEGRGRAFGECGGGPGGPPRKEAVPTGGLESAGDGTCPLMTTAGSRCLRTL